MSYPDHLVVVPGHALFTDKVASVPDDPSRDEHWILQSFQNGEPPYYLGHIAAGIAHLQQDPQSVLVFSGGRTREAAHEWSEASTYLGIAATMAEAELLDRMLAEPYARDSFDNLHFSLRLFQQQFSKAPSHITAVGWKFKKNRFAFHAATLGIPLDKFTYDGVNNPSSELLEATEAAEAKTLDAFAQDPRAKGEFLRSKKESRNPHGDRHPYPEISTYATT